MSGDVKYYGDWHPPREPFDQEPRMVRWLIRHSGNLIKNGSQASIALFVFSLVAFSISFYLLFF
ncbi:MAG: hypothetical protein A3G60_00910 [Candidatus Ryanbacteria bacterium RIFCSPLOWO2_12_FULL_47_9c]|uniref:Uncharacterized protein n=2 Tax=Candidatus Ryaniibacteriota TaxID=1817914 RepID=A0A1G2H5E7_9BACT|nr:MAG: hypothetical protein A3J04_04385 [Candidatus Ryanbacteria bacterium RIFCSPLOWO2_02_FULL_47_14]OGZ57695.1 MAG: hypothetical protein A3G60_00910 [Candidatus Ryanbacteria bacterium RIFCSPLOWO2_12_FULL_47_9c]